MIAYILDTSQLTLFLNDVPEVLPLFLACNVVLVVFDQLLIEINSRLRANAR